LSANEWNPTSYGGKYFNKFTYDANGNIFSQQRRNSNGAMLDSLTYHYLLDDNGNLVRNRLYHVNDSAGFQNAGDLTDQGTFVDTSYFAVENNNNYRYDEEGRLIQDLAEGIENIVWRVDGKVKKVIFTSASGKNNLEFDYDAFGRRIAKHVWTQGNVLVKSTYYILDAQGNQLSTYEHVLEDEESNFNLSERVIYGSSRLGINVNKVDLLDENSEELLSLSLGKKLYELSNHLGNVLTVINDIKLPQSSNTVDVDGYLATIVSTSDYSPFGVQLDGRTVSAESYRFGFQGQEKDNEIKGEGNSVNYTYRMHDPRLGRFFAVDPLSRQYPWYSSYQFSGNRVIDAIEFEGKEPRPYVLKLENSIGLCKEGQVGHLKDYGTLYYHSGGTFTQAGWYKYWDYQFITVPKIQNRDRATETFISCNLVASYKIGDQDWGTDGDISTFAVNVSTNAKIAGASPEIMRYQRKDGTIQNAFRHAVWQSVITYELDYATAAAIGYAHERFPNADLMVLNQSQNLNNLIFDNMFEADEVADLLNNRLARQLGQSWKDQKLELSRRDMAIKVLHSFWTDGFYVVNQDVTGHCTIERRKLTFEEYFRGLTNIMKTDLNGLNEKDEGFQGAE
jgi:RHS repeat-associated protein